MTEKEYVAKRKFVTGRRPVYLVEQGGTKFIAKDLTLREKKILGEVSHPLIAKPLDKVKIIRNGKPLTRPFTIFPYLGKPLIDTEKPIPIAQTLQYGHELIGVLNYLLSIDRCHGDLTPRNVVINSHAHLCDLEGSLKFRGNEFVERRMKTWNWAAPEVNYLDRIYRNSEVYSLGAALLGCLAPRFFKDRDVGGAVQLDTFIRGAATLAYEGFLKNTNTNPTYPFEDLDIVSSANVQEVPQKLFRGDSRMKRLLESMLEINQKNRPSIPETKQEIERII